MNAQVNLQDNEYLSMADFTLHQISNNSATINLKFVVSTPVPSYFLPNTGGAYHGAELLGSCSSPNPNTVDLATFLNGHINSQGVNLSTISCPTGTPTFYRISMAAFDTYQSTNPLNISQSFIAANRWGSPTNTVNSCVGDDNDANNNTLIWNSWYQKADNLLNAGLNATRVNHPNAVFLDVPFHSVSFVNNGVTYYYHYGLFWYGRVICV